jgi:hypothetical protein
MQQWGAIEADQEAWLADVFAGEGRQQRPEVSCDLLAFRHDLQRGSGFNDYDEIHVTVFVHPSSEKRAAGGHGHETLVSLQPRQSRLEERGVQFGQVTPVFKVMHVCLDHELSS